MTFEQSSEGEEGASHVGIGREQILGQGNSYCKAPREGAARRPVWPEGRGGEGRGEEREIREVAGSDCDEGDLASTVSVAGGT